MICISFAPTVSAFLRSGEPGGTLSISSLRFIITSQGLPRSSSAKVMRHGR